MKTSVSLHLAIARAPTTSGIYQLLSKRSGKCYVGQARNIRARLGQHLRQLRGGKHQNPALSAAWAKYPESDWDFKVLEHCQVGDLTRHETLWAKKTGALLCGYNCAPIQSGVDVTPAFRALARASALKYHSRISDQARTDAALKAWETRRRLEAAALAAQASSDQARSNAALKAWATRRRLQSAALAAQERRDHLRSSAAYKAWETRRQLRAA